MNKCRVEDTSGFCHVCKDPFEKTEKGTLKFGYAFCGRVKHYVKMCGDCLQDRKRNLGFYRNGHFIGPESLRYLFQEYIPSRKNRNDSSI